MRRRFATPVLSLLLPSVFLVGASCSSSGRPPSLDEDASIPHPTTTTVPDGGPPDGASDAPVVPGDAGPTNCGDGKQEGTETDIDCGGPTCPACADGKTCLKPTDCKSGVCTNSVCQVGTCTDQVQNGNETDVDCGGPNCGPCGPSKHCKVPSDCKDKLCGGNVCTPASCSDGVQNGTETDIDCGGACAKCVVGKKCGTQFDCTSGVCNGTCQCPKDMVVLPTRLQAGGDYCIDAYEVRKVDYYAFWNSNPSLATQPAYCAWNTQYTPMSNWPPVLTQTGYNGGEPVRSIDWCDAFAYCKNAGKHLCGHIGDGAMNDPAKANDALQSEWYNACSGQGTFAWPYGNTFGTGPNPGPPCLAPVAPAPTNAPIYEQTDVSNNFNAAMIPCQGGAAGLYNMSGDVAEWENSCTGQTGNGDTCLARGGSYQDVQAFVGGSATAPQALRCDAVNMQPRDTTSPFIGARCCL